MSDFYNHDMLPQADRIIQVFSDFCGSDQWWRDTDPIYRQKIRERLADTLWDMCRDYLDEHSMYMCKECEYVG